MDTHMYTNRLAFVWVPVTTTTATTTTTTMAGSLRLCMPPHALRLYLSTKSQCFSVQFLFKPLFFTFHAFPSRRKTLQWNKMLKLLVVFPFLIELNQFKMVFNRIFINSSELQVKIGWCPWKQVTKNHFDSFFHWIMITCI